MASTTYLALVNKVLRRVNEVEMSDTDFPSARGVHALAKDAVNASIQLINQAEFTWPFNVSVGTQVLTPGTEQYDWPDNFLVADWDSFYIIKDDAIGEAGHALQYINRDIWLKRRREMDEYSTTVGLIRPKWVYPGLGMTFGVSPSPDQAYTVTWDYWTLPAVLGIYTDTPSIPTIFDEVIILGALYYMYLWRDNTEQAQMIDKRFKDQLKSMRTLLINKDDRAYGTFLPTTSSRGVNSVSPDGFNW